jgi:hypothetical protein
MIQAPGVIVATRFSSSLAKRPHKLECFYQPGLVFQVRPRAYPTERCSTQMGFRNILLGWKYLDENTRMEILGWNY